MSEKLKFSKGNAKLDKKIHIFSLPAGKSCPGALICKSQVKQGKVVDGPETKIRCYAASQEAQYPGTFNARKHNYDLLKKANSGKAMRDLILDSLPKKAKYVRIHASGDFFNEKYFLAWVSVAQKRKDVLFYAYTKSVNYWVQFKDLVPANMILTASFGGRHDELINRYRLKHSVIVFSEEEAKALEYPIDHDDSHAMNPWTNFALLLHGTQPKGSSASKALVQLKKKGVTGYAR